MRNSSAKNEAFVDGLGWSGVGWSGVDWGEMRRKVRIGVTLALWN